MLVPSLLPSRIAEYALHLLDELGVACDREVDIVRLLEGRAFQIKFPLASLVIIENGPVFRAATLADHQMIFVRESIYDSACEGDPRARFVLAHELAHMVLHKGSRLRSRGRPSYRALRSRKLESAEGQADKFAECLLMPAPSIYGWDDKDSLSKRMNVPDYAADRRLAVR